MRFPLSQAVPPFSLLAVLVPFAIVVAGGMSLEPMFQPMGSVEVYANETWTLFSDGLPGALPGVAVGFGSGAALNATHMVCGGGAGQGVDGTEAFLFKLA